MKAPKRIIMEEAAIGVVFLIVAWYAYYLTGVWGFLEYTVEGTMKAYVTGPGIHVEILVSSLGLGILFALVNRATEVPALRRRPVGQIILVKSGLYLASVGLVILLVHAVFFLFVFDFQEIQSLWAAMSLRLLVALFSFLVLSFLGLAFLLEVRRKVGPGNLSALLTGRYHRPREEDRVFLFLDLKGSTSIAERLGHARYSQFIRHCFHDLTDSVLAYQAQIYQFVGDEVVLTWPESRGEGAPRSLATFFAFRKRLEERSDWYEAEFGIKPEFRGGAEGGRVTATEVGDIKREIAFHGDALNTAARLLELCGKYGESILVSGRIQEGLRGVANLSTTLQGEVQLRGRSEPMAVFGVQTPF